MKEGVGGALAVSPADDRLSAKMMSKQPPDNTLQKISSDSRLFFFFASSEHTPPLKRSTRADSHLFDLRLFTYIVFFTEL